MNREKKATGFKKLSRLILAGAVLAYLVKLVKKIGRRKKIKLFSLKIR